MSAREHASSTTKKTSRQQSVNLTQTGLLNNQSTIHPNQQTIRVEPDDGVPSFHHEISDIMRGFGDCDHPLPESVRLMEKIVQQQLKGILNDVIDVAIRRKGVPNLTQNDFEWMLRNHPARIVRLRKHVRDMKILRKILTIQNRNRFIHPDELEENEDDKCDDIDIEVQEKFDEEKTRRLFRADRISQILSGIQYQQFNEARRTSFYCRHTDRMKMKLRSFIGIPNDIRLTNSCYNLLSYLAHETIASVVDFAILTRLNSENRKTDPYSRIPPSGASYQMLHICPEVTQGRGLDGVKPITVQEIHEAIRRFNQCTRRGFGFYRNTVDADIRRRYIAI